MTGWESLAEEALARAQALVWLAWALGLPLRALLAPRQAVLAGAGLAALAALADPWLALLSLMVALFAPFSLVVTAMALDSLARPFRRAARRAPTPAWALALALAALLAYLAASMGVIAPDPYRLGYHPAAPGALVAILLLWSWMRGDAWLALACLAAQSLWLAGLGSDNGFDQIAHALLVPILALRLARSLLRRPQAPGSRPPA